MGIRDSITMLDSVDVGIPVVVNDLTPTEGPASGGNVITITGGNFKLFVPSEYGPTDGVAQSYVSVTFNGVPGVVYAYSPTELGVVVPPYDGDVDLDTFPAVDIVIGNLDAAGELIVDTMVSLSSAYTYKREPLRPPTTGSEPALVRIGRAILRLLKRDLLADTSLTTGIEYSKDGLVVAQAGVPAIVLTGPTVTPDAYGWESEAIEVTQEDGSVLSYPIPVMHTLEFGLLGFSDSKQEQHNLMTGLRKIFWRNPYLVLSGDLPPGSSVRMPMVMVEEPRPGVQITEDNLRGFMGSVEIRRVPILYLPAFYRSWPVSTVQLQTQKLNGTLVEAIAL